MKHTEFHSLRSSELLCTKNAGNPWICQTYSLFQEHYFAKLFSLPKFLTMYTISFLLCIASYVISTQALKVIQDTLNYKCCGFLIYLYRNELLCTKIQGKKLLWFEFCDAFPYGFIAIIHNSKIMIIYS